MNISVREAGDYFRGLLLLISKDRKVTEPEAMLMKRIGKLLGFEKEFCENAIQDVLENVHISPEAPRFSSPELAKKFVKDGLTLAWADDGAHEFEEQWLEMVARTNDLDPGWLEQERENARKRPKAQEGALEVDDLHVDYTHRVIPQ